ncbi:TonB-dependent receptor [Labilibacter sediminis]|nr:TonB-dependent receptor [Labilibacter sediminis]
MKINHIDMKLNFKTFIFLVFLGINSIVCAQEIVKGVVISADDNETLPGVSILIKGTSTGTITDYDGNFTINAPIGATLVVSFIGYQSQEIAVVGPDNLTIQLESDVISLDDVVVVGYGTQKKSDITGSVTSVQVAELQEVPIARADQALQGRVAGVNIVNNDASPNSNVSIRIRGVSSINGGSEPLVIVDGVQGASMKDVHPNDIQSMEVLKDASATSIYGSRGASGVILITTKKGKNEKPQVTFNTYVSISRLREKMDLMNAYQYSTFINENRIARDLPTIFSEEEISGFKQNGGTDWQDEIFRTGISHNEHLTISGSTESITYSVAGDYIKTKGIIEGSEYEKYSLRPNLSFKLNDKVRINLNSFFSLSEDNPTMLNARDRQGSPVYAALVFAPTRPVYMEDGSYSQPGGGYGPNTEFNPLALAKEPIRDNFSTNVIVNPSFEWDIVKGLNLNISGSYQLIDNEDNFYYNEKVVNGDDSDREASISDSRWTRFQNTNMLTYEKLFNEKHRLKLTGVYEQQVTEFNSNYSSASGFLTSSVTYNDLSLGSMPGTPYSYRSEESMQSFMGRVNYAYKDRYSISLTGRSDAASVFAENNKQAFFPSAGFAWNISQEEFMSNIEVVDNLKLRGSYGSVGNAAISPYQSLSQLVTGSFYSFDGDNLNNGVSLSTQAPNPDLKWETTKTLNVGVDLMMFRNRFSITADYYKKNTEDLLLERALYHASGFQTQLVNAGEVLNEGFEFAISGTPIQTGDFSWTSGVTFSRNRNEVLALNEGQSEMRLGGAGLPGFSDAIWLEVGQSIGLIRGVEYDGVWKSDEAILAAVYGVEPGSPKYVDQNNDGVINNEDVVNIANALPDFTYSWNNTFVYKNLSLNVFMTGSYGNDIYNLGRSRMEGTDGLSTALLNTWTPDNEDTDIPGHDPKGIFRNSDRWVEDGTYLRIKNITLGYTLPESFTQKLRIGSARIYATGTNLFTFTNYTGFDPEANNSNGSDTFAGVDLASYPSQKTYTIGLDIKF